MRMQDAPLQDRSESGKLPPCSHQAVLLLSAGHKFPCVDVASGSVVHFQPVSKDGACEDTQTFER